MTVKQPSRINRIFEMYTLRQSLVEGRKKDKRTHLPAVQLRALDLKDAEGQQTREGTRKRETGVKCADPETELSSWWGKKKSVHAQRIKS